jgi:oxygen-independent coproporphyrinogen-3 oxidase
MTSLRTIEGISLQTIRENWNDETVSEVLSLAQKFVRHQLVLEKDDHLVLMEKGKLFADGIAADLFGPYSAKYKTV